MKINLPKKLYILIFVFFISIAILITIFLPKKNKIITKVLITDPQNFSEEVLENKQISINFNKEISEDSKKNILIDIKPSIDFETTWLSNTLKIIPKPKLVNNTKYTITIMESNQEIYNFSFSTQTFSNEDVEKYGQLQTQDDLLFGEAQRDFYTKYPFYSKLPLKNSHYIVDFDSYTEEFIITLLNENTTKEEQDNYIEDALKNIKKLEVQEPIKYYVHF